MSIVGMVNAALEPMTGVNFENAVKQLLMLCLLFSECCGRCEIYHRGA
jgi:hypothetical protein